MNLKHAMLMIFSLSLMFTLPCYAGQANAPRHHGARFSHQEKGAQNKRRPTNKSKRVQKNWCDENVDPAYIQALTRLTKEPPVRSPRRRYGFRDLTIYTPHNGERLRVFPYRKNGALRQPALKRIKNLFRDKKSGTEHPIHPRLVKLLYKLADQFEAKQITIISAYRARHSSENNQLIAKTNSRKVAAYAKKSPMDPDKSKLNGTNVSLAVDWGAGDARLHAKGRAVDFFLPGIPLDTLASQARTLGHVGVGYYPNAHYVHLDVRRGPSVFWTDRGAPGKRRCYRRVMKKQARMYDQQWKKRDDKPERRPLPQKSRAKNTSTLRKDKGTQPSAKKHKRSKAVHQPISSSPHQKPKRIDRVPEF